MPAQEDEEDVMVQGPAVEESEFEDSQQAEEDQNGELALPEILPVMPLRDVVIFPGMMVPLIVSREQSVELVDDVVVNNKLIALVAQKSPEIEDPNSNDIFEFGTVGIILKMLKFPDGSVRILVQGLNRVRLDDFIQTSPYMVARVSEIEETGGDLREVAAKDRHLSSQFQKFLELNPQAPQELQVILMNIEDPGRRADIVASTINVAVLEKQSVLETFSVENRIDTVLGLLARELDLVELGSKLQEQVQDEVSKSQKEYFLREKLKAIKKELGEEDDREMEVEELRQKLEEANPPEEVMKEATRELDRLAQMGPGSAEHTVTRTYLDWILSLPWNISTEDNLDLNLAQEVLDEDHAGLEKIKERIIEYLAVRKLKEDMKGPIICFAGPPGVGKTSLGRSIARALGREFVRISLGGVRDEAEIRGHRRTYIGALPGRVIQGLKKAGTNNPLFMLDEIDKLGSDFRGDPSSALLEVLDPAQNDSFSDHYLDVAFDLSKVMFITTANYLENIPGPLRDRMEILNIDGYTQEEKVHIAKGYLVPKQLEEHGLKKSEVRFDTAALKQIIQQYTREAGVRNLEREIGSVCRKIAKEKALGNEGKVRIAGKDIETHLGAEKYYAEVAERTSDPGVVTGLAWTPVGGDILFIESTRMPGGKGFKLTGQLGDVMKESAEAAMSFVRANAHTYKIPDEFFSSSDIHLHVPGGAVPKDGPSAGVAMAISLLSLAHEVPVRPDVAMTGEITLRGRVLAVGGIKGKVLAAYRAGIKTILMPARNIKDLEDIPDEIRKRLAFHPLELVGDAVAIALPAVAPKPVQKTKQKVSKKKSAKKKSPKLRAQKA
jgi:ATP-dependent Lon protease